MRRRYCNPPINGGKNCTGSFTESRSGNNQECNCILRYEGGEHRALKFTEPDVDVTVTLVQTSSSGCRLRVFAVGGGGWGWGGGGSGYIQYHETETLTMDTEITLRVGDGVESSVININGGIIKAAAGLNGGDGAGNGVGGDGYSGGGGWSIFGADGGSNGGDGEEGAFGGGRGTGEDIKSFRMEHFVLSPGAGGKGALVKEGGGGGVLVNGEEPMRWKNGDGEWNEYRTWVGRGYGGGGNPPRPGVILLEISQ